MMAHCSLYWLSSNSTHHLSTPVENILQVRDVNVVTIWRPMLQGNCVICNKMMSLYIHHAQRSCVTNVMPCMFGFKHNNCCILIVYQTANVANVCPWTITLSSTELCGGRTISCGNICSSAVSTTWYMSNTTLFSWSLLCLFLDFVEIQHSQLITEFR